MADIIDVHELANVLPLLYSASGNSWKDYGSPTALECRAAIEAIIEYLDTLEGPVAMELPNTGIKVDRNEAGEFTLFFRVGKIRRDDV